MERNCPTETPSQQELTVADISRIAKEHGRAIYRSVLKRVRDPFDAEDILQNSLCIAIRMRSRFRGESAPETWICGIALNLVRNYFSRNPQKKYEFESEEILEQIADDEKDPADILHRSQVSELISTHLEALPEEMRKTLVLITEKNLSYEQVAKLMNVPIGTVRSRIFRARAYLKRFGSYEALIA
ncbi:MAG: hypothetical protein RIR70_2012 [Pseudomonadota bacterium]|jgi:RNA polymerase sigma-70 factor (ECF subfamily)